MSRERRMILWDRVDITYCKCPSLRYAHAHCPCEECDGKAVSRSTEYRHWMATKEHLSIQQSTVIRENDLSGQTACAGQEEQASVSQIMDQEIDSEPDMTQCSEDVTIDSLVPDNDQSDDHEQDLLREPEHAGL